MKKRKIFKKARKNLKIWEIESCYHCSILGTCLGPKDLEGLARKCKYTPETSSQQARRQHHIHSMLVSKVAEKGLVSKIFQKYMNSKYSSFLVKYGELSDDIDIERLWQADLDSGNIRGAYWAVMTHPAVSDDLRLRVYGHIHMKSHFAVVDLHKAKSKIRDMKKLLMEYEEKFLRQKKQNRKLENELRSLDETLSIQNAEIKTLSSENQELKLAVERLSVRHNKEDWLIEKKLQEKAFLDEQLRNARLKRRLEKIVQKTREKDKLIHNMRAQLKNVELENRALKAELGRREGAYSLLKKQMEDLDRTALGCEDCGTERCPGPSLCGKRILYVGGRDHLVPHYKQVAKKYGAELVHHDGGKERSVKQLPSLLSSVHAIICPMDCTSHESCILLRRFSKQHNKSFIPLKSSGVSSLDRCLKYLNQPQS